MMRALAVVRWGAAGLALVLTCLLSLGVLTDRELAWSTSARIGYLAVPVVLIAGALAVRHWAGLVLVGLALVLFGVAMLVVGGPVWVVAGALLLVAAAADIVARAHGVVDARDPAE